MVRSPRRSVSTQGSSPSNPPTSRPLFSSLSRTSTSSISTEPQTARNSLLNVLTRPRHPITAVSYDTSTTSSSSTIASSLDTADDEYSDRSTISSYTSSISSGIASNFGGLNGKPSPEELAKLYKNYLEKPFVTTKTTMRHSEFGHCNNPNWRWTSQVCLPITRLRFCKPYRYGKGGTADRDCSTTPTKRFTSNPNLLTISC